MKAKITDNIQCDMQARDKFSVNTIRGLLSEVKRIEIDTRLELNGEGVVGIVQKEIKKALDFSDEKPEGAVFIIPVRLEECKPPERLLKWHYADYFEGQRERGIQRLHISLRKRAESLNIHFEKPKLSGD